MLIKVQEQGTAGAAFIDSGYLTVYAREGSRLFDHFETDVSSGGRNPIPLSTGSDVNDEIGHHNVPFDAGSGSTLVVGEIFRKDGDTEVAGVVAAVTGAASATGTIDYFLLRQLTQFTDNDPCTAETSTKTFNINGTPTDLAPVTDTDIVFTFGGYTRNINNGNGLRPYSISVDPNAKSFARVYRRAKYITRRGSKFNINSEYGEAYRGETLQVEYNTQTGAFTEGLVVTASGGGTGVIVADHDDGATGDLILKNTRGTFTGTITDTATGSATIGSTRAISTQKTPLGVLAGVTYFGAPGMSFVLAQIEPGAETDYSLTDDDGITQTPPSLVSVAVTQVEAGDRIAVFRTVGGSIVKDEYASHATNNAQDDETFEVTTTISSEAPTNDAWIRVPYDQANQLEDRYFYTSFATTIFTLKVIPDSTVTTGDVNGLTFTATGSSFITEGVEVGMMVRNASDGNSIGTIASFTATTITLEERLAGGTENDFDNADVIHINTLVRAYDATDDVYVPFLDEVATGTTVNTTIVYSAPINTLIRVRQGGVIVPFETTSSITSTGMSVGAVRTPDTIAT